MSGKVWKKYFSFRAALETHDSSQLFKAVGFRDEGIKKKGKEEKKKKDFINNTEWFRQFLLAAAHSYITFGTVVLT